MCKWCTDWWPHQRVEAEDNAPILKECASGTSRTWVSVPSTDPQHSDVPLVMGNGS